MSRIRQRTIRRSGFEEALSTERRAASSRKSQESRSKPADRASQWVGARGIREVNEYGAYAGDVARGAGMAAGKAGRNVRGRHARRGRTFGGHSGAAHHGQIDQPGPGRTGVGSGAGAAEEFRREGDVGAVAVLEDSGGRTRVGDSNGGRGLGRLGGFEHAA